MLINLRNALMAGKRLPYDAEVEYLQSTGTQYIDIGAIIPPDVDFEFTGSIVSDMANGCIFGETNAFSWSSGNPGYSLVTTSGGKVYMRYGDNTSTVIGLTTIGTGNTFTASLSGTSFKINGQSVATVARISSFAGTVSSMGVFKRNHITSSASTYSAVRINSLKFGNLFDFIPVRKGTVGYLYDRVSGKLFGNAGTGDFVLGPDVVPVEYIESHGTEYINTGVVPTSLTKWDIDAQFTSSDYGQIMGRGGDPALNPRFAFGLDIRSSGHGLTWYCGMGNVNTWNGTFDTFRHTFSLDAPHKTFTIDATSYSVPLSSIGDTTIMQLFARFVNGSVKNFCNAKIFKSSVIDNGLPVRSFRPVRVGTEGAMMDVLTRRIYRNAGTGAFTYGNDLKYPIPAE